jgi:hypothetical protein
MEWQVEAVDSNEVVGVETCRKAGSRNDFVAVTMKISPYSLNPIIWSLPRPRFAGSYQTQNPWKYIIAIYLSMD